ncbi:MAG: hypothetical protein ACJ8EK_14470, partial [Bradyrhizobium sp.]
GRKAALVRSSADPSWLAPTKIRVSKMESRFAASLKTSATKSAKVRHMRQGHAYMRTELHFNIRFRTDRRHYLP